MTKNSTNKAISCTDHLGNKFSSVREMCKFHDVLYETYRKRRSKGYSIEQSLSDRYLICNGRAIECRDHKGKCFTSISEMAEFYGITSQIFRNRMRVGWSLEKTLTTPIKQYKNNLNIERAAQILKEGMRAFYERNKKVSDTKNQ